MNMPEIMTIKEVAAILKVSDKTLRRIIADKRIPVIWVRGSIRILASSLTDYIANGGAHL